MPDLTKPDLCLDGGPRHSWHGTGMDIVGEPPRCVYTAVCDWCGKEAARAKNTDPPYRSSVRITA